MRSLLEKFFSEKFKTGPTLTDAIAGGELAAMNVPQVLGYAAIAGVPIVGGLYTLLLPLIAFAALGSSRYLVVAADSATAAILAGGLAPLAVAGSPHYAALAAAVAFLTGAFLLLARVLQLAFLADFLSQTVLVGFLTGVGIQLAISSLTAMLGLQVTSTKPLLQLVELLSGLSGVHQATALASAAIVTLLYFSNKLAPRLPAPFLAVSGAIATSYAFHLSEFGIHTLGPVAGGLPPFGVPAVSYSEVLSLVPLAGSCAVMILAQSAATARFYAFRHQDDLNANADLLGLSVANIAAAVTGAFVVNGSPSQTAMVESSGGRAPWSHIATAIFAAVVLLFATRSLTYLPHCALSSIIFLLGLRLIDWRGLQSMREESPGEFALAILTVATVLIFGVQQGLLIAAVFSILRIIGHSYHPHTGVLVNAEAGGWLLQPPLSGAEARRGFVIYRFGAALYYANAGRFSAEIYAILNRTTHPVQWLVVDAEAISQLDYSAARSIVRLFHDLNKRGVTLAFARAAPYLLADMERHHVLEVIGKNRCFAHLKNAVAAFEGRAIE